MSDGDAKKLSDETKKKLWDQYKYTDENSKYIFKERGKKN